MNCCGCSLIKSVKLFSNLRVRNFNKCIGRGFKSNIMSSMKFNNEKQYTEEFFRKKMTPEQFNITRRGGTERAFTGKYYDFKEAGSYHCAGCEAPLFDSDKKYDSGSGWPSFFDANSENIELRTDSSHGMVRTEALCKHCSCHLGHVFDDGPRAQGGRRYCINSASLGFQKK